MDLEETQAHLDYLRTLNSFSYMKIVTLVRIYSKTCIINLQNNILPRQLTCYTYPLSFLFQDL